MLYVGPEAYAKPLVVCQRQGYGHNTTLATLSSSTYTLFLILYLILRVLIAIANN